MAAFLPRNLSAALAAALAVQVLAGCAVGPDFVRPTLTLPEEFGSRASAGLEELPDGAQQDPAFWSAFGDPVLTSLVEASLRENHDIRTALAAVNQTRALARLSSLERLPSVRAGASVSESQGPAPGASTRSQAATQEYGAEVVASWELDLFGRLKRRAEAGNARAAAAEADLAALQVLVVAEVCRTYFELRSLQRRIKVAEENAGNQADTLKLVEARLRGGIATEFDAARSRALLGSTQAQVPGLKAEAAAARYRLAVLAGHSPEHYPTSLDSAADLPDAPDIALATPAAVIRRRPDVSAAEHRLHTSTAEVGVQTADLFPRLTLGGLLGTLSPTSGGLFEGAAERRGAFLGIDWTFLDVGRVRARIRASEAAAEGALSDYQETVLLALEDTESALVRSLAAKHSARLLRDVAASSRQAAGLARMRYEAGATGLLEVLEADRERLEFEQAEVQERTRALVASVNLYKAMAGGWPPIASERLARAERPAGSD
jgi:NodT family efflux transporter outer membrane factor (OMF) lipoprotein